MREFGGVGASTQLGGKPLMVFTGELFETSEARSPDRRRQRAAAGAAAPVVPPFSGTFHGGNRGHGRGAWPATRRARED